MSFEKVLVTGGSGRLGRYVAEELKDRAQVTTFDIAGPIRGFPHIQGDICDLACLMKAFKGFDALIHTAALDGYRLVPPEDFMRVNAFGTWNVLHAAFETGVRKVVTTSCNSVAGIKLADKSTTPLYLPMDESHPPRPQQNYGISKYIGEITAESFGRRGKMEVATIRPTYIMFPELVPHVVARVAASDRGLTPMTGPEAEKVPEAFRQQLGIVRAYVEPRDLARLYRLVLETRLTRHEVFYGAAVDSYEPEPTLAFLKSIYGMLPPIRKPEVYKKNPYASTIDIAKPREILGWEPTTDWSKFSGAKRK